MTQEQETALLDQPDFAEDPEDGADAFYTVKLPIDLANSGNVELVFQADGSVSRTIDGVVIGSWV